MTEPKNQQIELTYGNLNDPQFFQILRNLVNHKFSNYTTSYRLLKVMDVVESESKKAMKAWNDINAKVEYVNTNPEDPKSPKVPKDAKAFEELQEEFNKTPCEVGNRFKIHINDLIGYELSAVDMKFLSGLVYGWEVLETESEQKGVPHGKVNQEASQQALN